MPSATDGLAFLLVSLCDRGQPPKLCIFFSVWTAAVKTGVLLAQLVILNAGDALPPSKAMVVT